jgi:hypothetical protein
LTLLSAAQAIERIAVADGVHESSFRDQVVPSAAIPTIHWYLKRRSSGRIEKYQRWQNSALPDPEKAGSLSILTVNQRFGFGNAS